ncbi:MAG: alpha-amylase [Acidobacteria bacterium]|nr:MAG: alpha-amylase [Acidobacteriota bacterium]
MASEIFDPSVSQAIIDAQTAARQGRTKAVTVSGTVKTIPSPFPSPTDWRDTWIYFLLLDRFNNDTKPPNGTWNVRFDHRQGGTVSGVRAQLGYLEQLGVKALWLSPVLKNSKPDWQFNYHGYGQQDFLNVDERLASDGTRTTAEREFCELVNEAHARGMYVILDIVLNHSARVFDYVRPQGIVSSFGDSGVMNGALGTEPAVEWLNGFGVPRPDWNNQLPAPPQLSPDDAVWPSDLQDHLFFRRRGSKLTDDPGGSFVRGDFGDMRQLVVEYDARVPGQEPLRARYGISPVLGILIRCYAYLMARYDVDGYRLDTVKYVDADAIQVFGNAMREFALSIGKKNFFTFGEVYDREDVIARFIGRNGTSEGYGIDAALDFPLFFKLPGVAKGMIDVREIGRVFQARKNQEAELLSSHGEAGRFFVSFLDNHDQHERIQHPATPPAQVSLAIALMFTLQGIPSIYYGTEQGLSGTVDGNGTPELNANESSREALWGKPNAFSTASPVFGHIRTLSELRNNEPPLRYGRLYFREVATQGNNFGHSFGTGGVVAFSRILVDREVLVIANTGAQPFAGAVILDRDLNAIPRQMKVAYSNVNTSATRSVRQIGAATFFHDGQVTSGPAAALDVVLKPNEVQVWTPV